MRGQLAQAHGTTSANYLIDCVWHGPTGRLLACVGSWDGAVTVCEASDSGVVPVACLEKTLGHRAVVRSSVLSQAGPLRIVTGGEDARICSWDLSAPPQSQTKVKAPSRRGKGAERTERGTDRQVPY